MQMARNVMHISISVVILLYRKICRSNDSNFQSNALFEQYELKFILISQAMNDNDIITV